MTTFPTIAVTKINEGFNLYAVYEDCYVSAIVTIPKGFVTDLASIPRSLWSILPPHGASFSASVLHDYYYTVHPMEMWQLQHPDYFDKPYSQAEERKVADQIFYDNLIAAGISKLQAKTMYAAVRLFGSYRFKHYGKSRKRVRHEEKIMMNRIDKGLI